MCKLFALHDSDEEKRKAEGSREVTRTEAERLNAEGYGIFVVPNAFNGRRVQANLTEIRYWFAEVDQGTKAQQLARLKRSPLLPTAVVESARGYHAYFRVRGQASPENWKQVVRWRLVPALGGDIKATDVLRLLRCPGFYHMKDPSQPFMVNTVWKLDTSYTEQQMLRAFKNREPTRVARELKPGEGGFWERVSGMDAGDAIVRLNGHWLQKAESFVLKEQGNGNRNIVRSDGLDTGVFCDPAGRLGAVASGSSVAAWLAWYGWSWADIARGLKEVFPELGADD